MQEYEILEYIKDNTGRKTKCKVKHNCGWSGIVSLRSLRDGRCVCKNKECRSKIYVKANLNKNSLPDSYYINMVNIIKPLNGYSISSYKREKRKNKSFWITLKHNCGYEFEVDIDVFKKGLYCCRNKECKSIKYRSINLKPVEYYEEKVKEILDNKYELINIEKKYIGSYIINTVNLLCKSCNCKFNVFLSNLYKDKYSCRNDNCVNHYSGWSSHAEIELLNYCKSLRPDAHKLKPRELTPYELDIYIPSLSIGFEYNGFYYHSFDGVRITRDYHRNKTQLFLDKGIKVYHLWEDISKEKAENIIKAKLGILPKIYARNCKIVELSKKESDKFFDKYHSHGTVPACYRVALIKDKDILSVISLRRNKGNMEIARYASKANIVGGFRKLLNKCIEYTRINKCNKIISYCDRDLTPDYHDSVYYRNKFNFIGDMGVINRFYNLNTKEIESRQKYQDIKKVFPGYDKSISVNEFLISKNILPFYNSGNWKFELEV